METTAPSAAVRRQPTTVTVVFRDTRQVERAYGSRRSLREYQRAIAYGGILMGVRARSLDDARQIAIAWKQIGGQQVHA